MTAATMTIATLDRVDEFSRAAAVIDEVWGAPDTFGVNHIRAIQHAGGYVAGLLLNGRMVGASVAFLGRATGADGRILPTLHSHITGVLPEARGVGMALKMHQRDWCRTRDIAAITWTFDPLVARNAYFNVTKLGAQVRGYLVDHYGPMHDGINNGEPSDRLDVWWPVSSAVPGSDGAAVAGVAGVAGVAAAAGVAAVAGVAAGGRLVLSVGPDGGPVSSPTSSVLDGPLVIRIPTDIEALRHNDPSTAAPWRLALREALQPALESGRAVVRVDRSGAYHLGVPSRVVPGTLGRTDSEDSHEA